jgi:protein-disulfide isomerase
MIDRADMQESRSHMVIFPNPLDMPFVRFRDVPCAEISLVEFGDYTCPMCRQAESVVHSLLEQFPGRILFGYWHFPSKEMRPDSEIAAEACEAAGAQGRFWEYSEMLFERAPSFDERALIERAEELGLDVDVFREDLSSHRYLARVRWSVKAGRAMGIRSTPSFLVDGQLVDASFGLHDLRAVLRAALG